MKKLGFLATLSIVFALPLAIGCGSDENVVIEAPAEVVEEQPAIEGMDDEDYDAAMDAEMEG